MKNGLTLLLAVFFGFLLTSAFAKSEELTDSRTDDVALSIGRSTLWSVARSGEISVSNGAAIRVKDQGPAVKITAVKLGSSVVRSGSRQLEVHVLPEASYRIYANLHDSIRGRRGLSISSADGSLRIVGRLLRAADWLEIGKALPSADAGRFSFQASLEPEVETQVRKDLQTKLAQVGLSQVNLRFTPEAVATVGTEPKDAKERAEKVLAPFGIRVEMNTSVIPLEPMVRVKIVVAEIKKSYRKSWGISWDSVLKAQLLPTTLFPVDSFNVILNAMEEKGWGRVLASPTLLCRSGKEAEFMAGGEIPIKLSSFSANSVVWKSYGILLKVKPLADASGRMSIAIETEVSALDDARKTADGIPGLLTNRMQTHFDLTKSRTIALSGLIRNQVGEKKAGLPGLGSIPILGPLFSSQDFVDDRSELMIFVTPAVSLPDDDSLEEQP